MPMQGAGLKYDANGAVAWDQIWGSFCDLAMAGGPPHKGTLLEHGSEDGDRRAVRPLRRGGRGDLPRHQDGHRLAGVRVADSWLGQRHVSQRHDGRVAAAGDRHGERGRAARAERVLELPAAPHFRLEKEIKNVITVIAKTCHYWMGHMPADAAACGRQPAQADGGVAGAAARPIGDAPRTTTNGRLQPPRRSSSRPDSAGRRIDTRAGLASSARTCVRPSG